MPYIDPTEIERVKELDLLTYLEQREPDELVRLGNDTYCTKTHDSLKLSNGKFYWWSQGIGGKTALDYLIKVRGMAFLDAVRHLGATDYVLPAKPTAAIPSRPQARELLLPPAEKDNAEAVSYLTRRGIAPSVISHCIDAGLVYATRNGRYTNVVFVGKDGDGSPRYAAIRATQGSYKGEARGSDKRFSFRLGPAQAEAVHVFEGAIDALSYATLVAERNASWQRLSLLALSGIAPARAGGTKGQLPLPLAQYLEDSPQTTQAFLHLDNDAPGRAAAATIASALRQRGIKAFISPPPRGHDVNEYLMLTHAEGHISKQRAPGRGRPYRAEKKDGRSRAAVQERSR
jgi:hypothetical protein